LYFTEEGEVRVRFLEDGIQRVVKAEGELIGRLVDPDPDPAFFLIADPGSSSELKKKFTGGKKIGYFFFIKICNLVIRKASIKDTQATGEACSPQKRTSSTSKHENSLLFSNICRSFLPPPGSGSRIQQLKN
jgi:hypothetical protein